MAPYRGGGTSSVEIPHYENRSKYPPSDIRLPLIKRKFWYGLKPKGSQLEPMHSPHTKVCFVPTETTPCDTAEECIREVSEIQKRNMVFRDWPDTPFNFLIGGDGNIYEGRGWLSKYKDRGDPSMHETLQIGYIGHFLDRDPPEEMVKLGGQLIDYGKERKYIDPNYTIMTCPLKEYYQFPPDMETFWASKEYKEFLETMPPPPPPRPTEEPPPTQS